MASSTRIRRPHAPNRRSRPRPALRAAGAGPPSDHEAAARGEGEGGTAIEQGVLFHHLLDWKFVPAHPRNPRFAFHPGRGLGPRTRRMARPASIGNHRPGLRRLARPCLYPVPLDARLHADQLAATEPGRHDQVLDGESRHACVLELGPQELEFHREAGRSIPKSVDRVIAVGPRSRALLEGAASAGFAADHLHQPGPGGSR